MQPRVLEYFLRTVEFGSINRAAAELGMSQPSLSRWLALLEREMGVALLIRSARGIRPTDAGALLIERSRPVLRQIELLHEEIGRGASAQVALAMPFALQRLVTAPLAELIAARHTHIALRLYEGMINDIRRRMEDGLIDLGVVVSIERTPESFEVHPLVREQLMLVGSRAAPLDLGSPVRVEDVAAESLILPERPNAVRALVEAAFASCGGTYRPRMEAETVSLCLELTRRGLGQTVMPFSALHGRLDPPAEFRVAPIRGFSLTWTLCVNRARVHSVALRQVQASLRSQVERQVASGAWTFAALQKA